MVLLLAAFACVVVLLLLYGSLLWQYRYLPESAASPLGHLDSDPPFISVVIAARNEATHILLCLHTLLEQTYPSDRYEIIVVDDHSTDETVAMVNLLTPTYPHLRLLHLHDYASKTNLIAYKKAALTYGIQQARGTLIATTDADCILPPYWLHQLAGQSADFLIAPVQIAPATNLCAAFQTLDMAGVMQLTIGSAQRGTPLLCNGANLAFRRSLFQAVGGYTGIDHLASGDDVLLLQKVKQHPSLTIQAVPGRWALAITAPEPSWSALWQQRLRWAGKTGAYRDARLLTVQAVAFALCWCAIFSLFLPFFRGMAGMGILLLVWGGKAAIDYIWLRASCTHFADPLLLRWFWPAFFLHTCYVAIIGLLALLPHRTVWKGRPTR